MWVVWTHPFLNLSQSSQMKFPNNVNVLSDYQIILRICLGKIIAPHIGKYLIPFHPAWLVEEQVDSNANQKSLICKNIGRSLEWGCVFFRYSHHNKQLETAIIFELLGWCHFKPPKRIGTCITKPVCLEDAPKCLFQVTRRSFGRGFPNFLVGGWTNPFEKVTHWIIFPGIGGEKKIIQTTSQISIFPETTGRFPYLWFTSIHYDVANHPDIVNLYFPASE